MDKIKLEISLTYACHIVGNDDMPKYKDRDVLLGDCLFTISRAIGLLNLTMSMHR